MKSGKSGNSTNPHQIPSGSTIPNFLLLNPKVSIGAKLLYGILLVVSEGKNDCSLTQQEIADKMCSSVRQVSRYLKDLIENGLIEKTQVGLQQPNTYHFKPIDKCTKL